MSSIDESNEFELTDKGIHAWQECTNGGTANDDFVMLDISDEYIKIDENPNP